jgi:uncharacterized membrane protein YgdD (TMEM256/DUF423 family)
MGPVGIITPIGGVVLIAGWVLFFFGVPATRQNNEKEPAGKEQG